MGGREHIIQTNSVCSVVKQLSSKNNNNVGQCVSNGDVCACACVYVYVRAEAKEVEAGRGGNTFFLAVVLGRIFWVLVN